MFLLSLHRYQFILPLHYTSVCRQEFIYSRIQTNKQSHRKNDTCQTVSSVILRYNLPSNAPQESRVVGCSSLFTWYFRFTDVKLCIFSHSVPQIRRRGLRAHTICCASTGRPDGKSKHRQRQYKFMYKRCSESIPPFTRVQTHLHSTHNRI